MSPINTLLHQMIPAFDIVAAILVTLYISVAVFAAQNLFKPAKKTQLSVSGRHYVKLLKFRYLTILLLTIPILTRINELNVLTKDYRNIKSSVIFVILVFVCYLVYRGIKDILTQKALNSKLTKDIPHPTLKFAAFLISNEKEWSIEKRDLIESSLKDIDIRSVQFEEYLLNVIIRNSQMLLMSETKSRNQAQYLEGLLQVFSEDLPNRPLSYPIYFDELFGYLIQSWFKVNTDKAPYSEAGIYSLRLTFMKCLKRLGEFGIKNGESYSFFTNLRIYLNQLDDDDALKFLLSFGDKFFFEDIPDSPEKDFIWEDFFPQEWLFTNENIFENPNPMACQLLNRYFEWSKERFFKGEGIDEKLDEVTTNLFPELDPILWARILEYRHSAWSGESRIEFVLRQKGNFGVVKLYPTQNYVDEETSLRQMREHDATLLDTTLKFTLALNLFNVRTVDQALREIDSITIADLDKRQQSKLSTYRRIFTELKRYLTPANSVTDVSSSNPQAQPPEE